MTSWESSRSPAYCREHPPATRDTYEKLDAWRRQAWAKRNDPTAPEPDHTLLFAGEPTQLLSLTLGEMDGRAAVWLKVNARKHDFKERVVRPEALAIARGATLYGGGLNVDNNGGTGAGLSYLRLYGGGRNVQLSRLLIGAGPDEVARQLPQSYSGKDFRVVMPENHIRSGPEVKDAEGRRKPSRAPTRGRSRAVRIALDFYYGRNHSRTDIGLTAAEYEAFLWDLYALHDAIQAAR